MKDRRFKIYVSSTLTDLIEHRQVVIDAILKLGAVPMAVEMFAASSDTPREVCRNYVQESDALVLILGYRYGASIPGEEISLTELEFDTALQAGIPILAFMVDEHYPWPPELVDRGEAAARLTAFKARVMMTVVVGRFSSPSDLGIRVIRALEGLAKSLKPTADVSPLPKEAPTPPEPRISESDQLVIRIEEHLNSLRTGLAEMRDQFERSKPSYEEPNLSSVRVASFLGPAATAQEKDLCFVAMPYSQEWSKALEDILLDICKAAGMRLLIAKHMDGRFIPHDIWQGITAAAVIIADITNGNPNVAYEIGLADVLGKEVILLCQGDDVPFDFLGQRLICYENTMKGSIMLREELSARLQRVRDKLNDV